MALAPVFPQERLNGRLPAKSTRLDTKRHETRGGEERTCTPTDYQRQDPCAQSFSFSLSVASYNTCLREPVRRPSSVAEMPAREGDDVLLDVTVRLGCRIVDPERVVAPLPPSSLSLVGANKREVKREKRQRQK